MLDYVWDSAGGSLTSANIITLRHAEPSHFNVKTSDFCRTILLHKSNIQNPCFALFGLYLKDVNLVNLSAYILTHFTREKVALFGDELQVRFIN